MTEVNSKLILASINTYNKVPIYTFVLTYPRIILAEVNTHRMLSRNTASSRAIPSAKQRSRVMNDPFIPSHIGANKKGMQAGEEIAGWKRDLAEKIWEYSRYPMVFSSWALDKLGVHKQIVNRLVEPWMWVQQIVTATDLKNVFLLRNNDMAEPHFHELAAQMQRQVERVENWAAFDDVWKSGSDSVSGIDKIQWLSPKEWHLPFIRQTEKRWNIEVQKKVSAARCARVSYYLQDGKESNISADVELADKLSTSGHWSPFEHPAQAVLSLEAYHGNFRGWKQYRKEFSKEDGGDRGI